MCRAIIDWMQSCFQPQAMASPFWLYRLGVPLSVRINVTAHSEDFTDNEMWLICEQDNHKLLGRVKSGLMESLLIESEFSEKQDIKVLFQNWRGLLTKYLYSIRYLSLEDRASLLYRDSALFEKATNTGEESTYQYSDLVNFSYTRGPLQEIHFFTKDKFDYLQRGASGHLVDYVELYVDVSALKDPVAKLLGFASLIELINQQEGEEIALPEPFKSARNLVAHGFVSGQDTVNALNHEFNTSLSVHTFSRDNQDHLSLVQKETEKANKAIQAFIKSQLPQSTNTIYMNG